MHARQIEGLFKRDRRDPLAVIVAVDQAEQPAAQAALASSQSPGGGPQPMSGNQNDVARSARPSRR